MTNQATGASKRHDNTGAVGSQVDQQVRPLSQRLSGWLDGETLQTSAELIHEAATAIDRLETLRGEAMRVLEQIATMPRRTREQRLASACVHFLDALSEPPTVLVTAPAKARP